MSVQSAFQPAWWLRNKHLQTIYPALLRRSVLLSGCWRERLFTPDNDFIDIDYCGKGNGPLVILLHGLTGSSNSGYILGLQKKLLSQGWRSAALNFRGCSGEPNWLARAYHSGDTGDLDFLFESLRKREPDTEIAVIGVSLGGNVLLKWLGEQSNRVSVTSAVAVSVPLVLSLCAEKMDLGFSRLYRNRLLMELKQYMARKHAFLRATGKHTEAEKITRLGDLAKIKSFWEYDDRVVAPLHGFRDVHDYYRLSSSRQYLKDIAIPTLLLQDRADPFMTEKVIPGADELSSKVCLEVTEGGGHVGYINGQNPLRPGYWLEMRIVEFLRQHWVVNYDSLAKREEK